MSLRNTIYVLAFFSVWAFIALSHQKDSRTCRAAGYDAVMYSLSFSEPIKCVKDDNGDLLTTPLKLLQH